MRRRTAPTSTACSRTRTPRSTSTSAHGAPAPRRCSSSACPVACTSTRARSSACPEVLDLARRGPPGPDLRPHRRRRDRPRRLSRAAAVDRRRRHVVRVLAARARRSRGCPSPRSGRAGTWRASRPTRARCSSLYRRALAVRRATPDLTSAGFELLLPDDPDLVVYRRGDVVVVLNMSDHERNLPADLVAGSAGPGVVGHRPGRSGRRSSDRARTGQTGADSIGPDAAVWLGTLTSDEREAGLEVEHVECVGVDGEARPIAGLRSGVRLDAGHDDPVRRCGGVLGGRRVDADGVGGDVEDDLGAEPFTDVDDAADRVGRAVGADAAGARDGSRRRPAVRRSRRATGTSRAPTPAP